ncbi:MAG: hypothetical protein EHM28_12190 [Spirochaetaceae bacterium]|nr:MAG: hypothetical protein EHM28_12190 [Spirochaetaceae bacterium]
MKGQLIRTTVISMFGLMAAGGIVFWFTGTSAYPISPDLPGRDNKPASLAAASSGEVKIGEYFLRFSAEPLPDKYSWPRFRGTQYDNIAHESIALPDSWETSAPKIIWNAELGEGHSGPAVHQGRVYILDYDEQRKADTLRCFSLATGKELWRRWYNIPLKRNHGISRTIPAVTDSCVVTIGPSGQVMCVDALNGDFLWGIDLERDFDAEIPQWYTAQCPVIDGDEVILAPAGTVLLMGVDCATGRINWKTPNPGNITMSHSSIMPANLSGKKMYVYAGIGGTAGVSAEKADRGKLLWITREWDNSVIAPSPVVFPDGRIFLTAGYGGGSMMIKVTHDAGVWNVSTLFRHRPKEGLACEQQTPLLANGLLYGVMPKDGGEYKNQFVCANPATGKIIWSSGKTVTFGLGPYIYADDKFFLLSDTGTLSMAKADKTGFRVTGQFTAIPKARDAWAPMALAGNRLLLRDSTRMFCLEF